MGTSATAAYRWADRVAHQGNHDPIINNSDHDQQQLNETIQACQAHSGCGVGFRPAQEDTSKWPRFPDENWSDH